MILPFVKKNILIRDFIGELLNEGRLTIEK